MTYYRVGTHDETHPESRENVYVRLAYTMQCVTHAYTYNVTERLFKCWILFSSGSKA